VPVRYMGTKRYLAPYVRNIIDSLRPHGPVVDLFSGIGAVTSALAPMHHVITNDALSFTVPLARARFGASRRSKPLELQAAIRLLFRQRERQLRDKYRVRLAEEAVAMECGWRELAYVLDTSRHVGNCAELQRKAVRLAATRGAERYSLITLYFAGGYFSTFQAIQLDSLRYAIDHHHGNNGDKDWLLAAWLSAAATIINAPGHTAQFLRASSEATHNRVRRAWTRNVWDVFQNRLADLGPEGTYRWRVGNRFVQSEALALLKTKTIDRAGCIYADPPYTKDHYSRYYHVYETMYKYDYPDSLGRGRYRSDRFVTGFSLKTQVANSFESLISRSLELGVPLVVSYPQAGLLTSTGADLGELLRTWFKRVDVTKFAHEHSTMGASDGRQKKRTVECIYACTSTT
jgi:adenine-specific DNA-methyltransferase